MAGKAVVAGDDYTLVNRRVDGDSSYWKKKFTLLLKKTDNVEIQNLRLMNRLYQIKNISKQLAKEKRFLMKRLDTHGDDYKSVEFYQGHAISDGLNESAVNNNLQPTLPTPPAAVKAKLVSKNSIKTLAATKKGKTKKRSSQVGKQKYDGPKKPLNAFLWFCQEQREVILREKPGITHQELTKLIGTMWNALQEEAKEVYYGMFEKDKKRYEGELREYNKSKGRPPLANPSTPKGKASKRAAASSLSGGSGAKKKKKVVKKKIPVSPKADSSKEKAETPDNFPKEGSGSAEEVSSPTKATDADPTTLSKDDEVSTTGKQQQEDDSENNGLSETHASSTSTSSKQGASIAERLECLFPAETTATKDKDGSSSSNSATSMTPGDTVQAAVKMEPEEGDSLSQPFAEEDAEMSEAIGSLNDDSDFE